jgi:hypothetical protein
MTVGTNVRHFDPKSYKNFPAFFNFNVLTSCKVVNFVQKGMSTIVLPGL